MLQSFKQILPISLVLGALAVATPNQLVERQTSSTCAPLHLMIAGGCLIPCSADVAGLLSTTIANITAAYPGADQYIVPYNASTQQAQVSTPLMVAAANAYSVSCPNTPIVFIGYSLGGIVVMNTLCGGISANPNVIAAIVYGEETYTYPQPYDVGTCTNQAPQYPRSAARVAACAPFASAIQSYCDAADPQCCAGGTNQDAHYAYPAKYDLSALAFVNTKYTAFKASQSSSSPSSSSTALVTSTSSSALSTSSPAFSNSTSSSASSSLVVPITTATSTSTTSAVSTTSSTSPASPVSSTSSAVTSTIVSSSSSTPLTTSISSSTPTKSTTSSSSVASSSSAIVVPIPASSTTSTSTSTSVSTTTHTLMSGSSTSASSSTVPATITAPKSSATVAPYTGAASTLSVPGFVQSLFKVWKGVASLVVM